MTLRRSPLRVGAPLRALPMRSTHAGRLVTLLLGLTRRALPALALSTETSVTRRSAYALPLLCCGSHIRCRVTASVRLVPELLRGTTLFTRLFAMDARVLSFRKRRTHFRINRLVPLSLAKRRVHSLRLPLHLLGQRRRVRCFIASRTSVTLNF